MAAPRSPKVAVIGGGTGSFAVLSALKYYVRDLTAIVNMADDGGSTGLLRDELGVLPPGDVRQCLVALSESSQLMRDLFNYRFDEGSLHGHPFGNLFLTALEKTTGSFAQAVRTASEILNITGQVVPVTLDDCELVLEQPDGTILRGQYAIQETSFASRSPRLSLTQPARLNPDAAAAIAAADLIVIAPGNLYTSLTPALLVGGLAEALQASPARLVYVCNLVTKPGQTDGFQVHDYAAAIERLVGPDTLDYVIYNRRLPSRELLKKYAHDNEFPVGYDEAAFEQAHYTAIGGDLVSDVIPQLKPSERTIPRTLIRHDGDAVARLIMRIFFSQPIYI